MLESIWTTLTEHGPLVVFAVLVGVLEWGRIKFQANDLVSRLFFFAELATGVSMVLPRVVRAAGDMFKAVGKLLEGMSSVTQTLFIEVHNVLYAIVYGRRRPAIEEKQKVLKIEDKQKVPEKET